MCYFIYLNRVHIKERGILELHRIKKKKRSVYAKTLPPPLPLLVKTIENYILITDSIEEF